MSKLRIGVVEYLNAMPLWHGLREDADVELVAAKPSELAALLREGAIDTGLLPVIEYFRNPGVLLAKGMGVACRGAVRSVLIFLKKPVPEVKRVRLDASSRTSQCLTRIVLEELYGLQPEYREAAIAPGELLRMEEDAALMIGDPALQALVRADVDSIDLGRAWRQLTGLPFVFAGWLVREGLAVERGAELVEKLRASLSLGMRSIPQIAKEYSGDRGLDRFLVEDYLTNSIRYELGDFEMQGLEAFAQRASARGLCEARGLELVG